MAGPDGPPGRNGEERVPERRRRNGAGGGSPARGRRRGAAARLALRRRTAPGPFRIGELEIDRVKRRVTMAGCPVRLTATEYKLRRKLGDGARSPRYILGERGLGYRMPEPDEA